MTDVTLSIVICTYNRADLAANCLASVRQAMAGRGDVDVIVVDNNSSDQTKEVIQAAIGDQAQARYVFEPAQGLSHARNRGAAEAAGDYVGYIDDECIVDKAWLDAALHVIGTHRPALFGGPYGAWYRGEKPAWYKDHYASTDRHVREARALHPNEFVSGGNLFVERKWIDALGGFDPDYGMTGTKVNYGEETDFQIRLRAHDPNALIYFDPRVFLRHLVRPEKLDLSHIARLKFAAGRTSSQIFSPGTEFAVRRRGVACARCAGLLGLIVFSLLSGWFCRNRDNYPYFKSFFFEVIGTQITRLGGAWEQAFGERRSINT